MLKEKILFKCYSGSKLYGTNNENSDTDIKGVFLPDFEDLILGKAPKCYQFSTSDSEKKNSKDDIDECYYSLHYFFELLSKGDTNALDLLFAYTNYEQVIIDTPEWSEIVENKDKLLTKNMKAYMGYCKHQCFKYSVKGEKLNNLKKFANFLSRKNSCCWADNGDNTLYWCLNSELKGDINNKVLEKYIPKVGEERIKFTEIDFGENCYIERANNKEVYLVIYDAKFQLQDWCENCFNKVEKAIHSYGERAKKAQENNGVDLKAISHAIRVSLQVEELLYSKTLRFPLKDANFVKSIKYNTTKLTYDEIMNWLERKISYIEKELLPISNLRECSDFEWIRKFILKQYRK